MFTAAWLRDTLERVAKTAVQAFAASFILTSAYHLSASRALVIAAIAAGLAGLKAVVATAVPDNVSPASLARGRRPYLTDMLERLVFSFVEGFAAAMISDYHLSSVHSAVLAGITAVVSLLMSMVSLSVPSTLSPASLVARPPATATEGVRI